MKTVIAILVAISFLSPMALAETQPPASKDFLRKSQTSPFGSHSLQQYCCKICSKGKACGDTCIARDRTCHVGPGCACNG